MGLFVLLTVTCLLSPAMKRKTKSEKERESGGGLWGLAIRGGFRCSRTLRTALPVHQTIFRGLFTEINTQKQVNSEQPSPNKDSSTLFSPAYRSFIHSTLGVLALDLPLLWGLEPGFFWTTMDRVGLATFPLGVGFRP